MELEYLETEESPDEMGTQDVMEARELQASTEAPLVLFATLSIYL